MKDYVTNGNTISGFDMWAVLLDKKYDKDMPDSDDQPAYEPTYPCKAELYKMVNNTWVLVKVAPVKSFKELMSVFPKPVY